jgi:hypothetical protein
VPNIKREKEMSAQAAWDRLNKAINVGHYIGPNAKAEIDKAINPPAKPVTKKKHIGIGKADGAS